MHGDDSYWVTSDLSSNKMPEVFFITLTPVERCANPIIGPPRISLPGSHLTPPQSFSASEIGVPRRSRQLPGLTTGSPVIVVTRSINGIPALTASATAAAVPAFCTIQPTSAGKAPVGTLRLVTA